MADTGSNAASIIELPERADVCIVSTPGEAARAQALGDIKSQDAEVRIAQGQVVDPVLHVTLPVDGASVAYVVEPGMTVELARSGFEGAAYTVVNGGLLIEPVGGGAVFIEEFASSAVASPPLLISAFGFPAMPVGEVLAGFDPSSADPAAIEPAAGDETALPVSDGGGADFSAYAAGSIGAGLGVTGVLDPTQLGRSVTFPDLHGARASEARHASLSTDTGSHGAGETGSGGGNGGGETGSGGGDGGSSGPNNHPPVAEPHKFIILPDHVDAITMNTHSATDVDGDTLTYQLGDIPDQSIATITLGSDGTQVKSGQILTEQEYLSLQIDPAPGSAGSEFELYYTVRDGKGGSDQGSFTIRLQDATGGPWAETGGDGHDVIRGSYDSDRIYGGAGDDYIKGGSGDDQLWGQSGDDRVHGGGGDDIIVGGAGHDYLVGNEGDDLIVDDLAGILDTNSQTHIFGGEGNDTLRLDGSGMTLDLNLVDDARIQGIEEIDLAGGGNRLVLDAGEVLNISATGNVLTITGSGGDAVSGHFGGATVDTSHADYTSYSFNGATLVVENTVDQSGIVV